MRRPTSPYCLHFRLRPEKASTYRQLYLRLTMNGRMVACGCGVFVEANQWRPYRRQSSPTFNRVALIENKLDAVREQLRAIYEEQLQQSVQQGWTVTARTIVRQFRGLPPILRPQPIAPCPFRWMVISSLKGREGRAYV